MSTQIPVVDYLKLGDSPHLAAHECTKCGALYFDRRNACARCFTTSFGSRTLSNEGTVRAFTAVHRVKRPFTSVIVDLDGGGVVKANLTGVDDPAQITAGMRVVMTTVVAGSDDDGVKAVAFAYRPKEDLA